MSEQVHVQVTADGPPVPGLVLKWDRDGARALVTYEADGHVRTQWVPAEQVLAVEA
ncbi:hypothetical protein RB608_17990 [Nocardioides sp. LHD-245]|uniref:hypothetical protein n=1 Tax=Nocardioides sp. LHD-245 TaxID=3051387 RepID=UPI0027E1ACBD|nr:hypothetical protein [Nocardioides sp. LHD-245]